MGQHCLRHDWKRDDSRCQTTLHADEVGLDVVFAYRIVDLIALAGWSVGLCSLCTGNPPGAV